MEKHISTQYTVCLTSVSVLRRPLAWCIAFAQAELEEVYFRTVQLFTHEPERSDATWTWPMVSIPVTAVSKKIKIK